MFIYTALVAQPAPELGWIRERFRSDRRLILREFLALDRVNRELVGYRFHLMVLRYPTLDEVKVKAIARIRARFPWAGIMIVSPSITPGLRYQLREVGRHRVIHELYEMGDIVPAAFALMKGEVAAPRLHSRVKRDDEAELLSASQKWRARIVDIAQMGARVWVESRTRFKPGDRYQLHYRSSVEADRIHRIETKVVWSTVEVGRSGAGRETLQNHHQRQQLGLRFVAAL